MEKEKNELLLCYIATRWLVLMSYVGTLNLLVPLVKKCGGFYF